MASPTVTSGTSTSPPTLSGLSSGLDTDNIVTQLMAIDRMPEKQMQINQSRSAQRQSLLQDFSTKLKALKDAADALGDVTMWAPKQKVTSSDASRVTAVMTSGAGVGGTTIQIDRLASSTQRSYTYTTNATADDSIIFKDGSGNAVGSPITIPKGSDISAAVAAINASSDSPVYAAVVGPTGSQKIYLSSKTTGAPSAFTVDATSTTMSGEALVQQGLPALYEINNGSQLSSDSNTLTDSIPGISLTLNAVTAAGSPVTINVTPPAVDQTAVTAAVNTFISSYNTVVDWIRTKTQEQVVPNPQTANDYLQGVLHGDSMLTNLQYSLRNLVAGSIGDVPGLPSTLNSLMSLGISTGATTGSATFSQDAVNGKLTLDPDKLTAALTSDPTSVKKMFTGIGGTGGFSADFDTVVNPITQANGILDSRIQSETSTQDDLAKQISDMEDRLKLKEDLLKSQFSAMESAMSQSQSLQAQLLQSMPLPGG
jgi:flagellar hook-associated protein 2